MNAPLSREERLREYFRRLGGQPPSQTAEDALERIIVTLDEVEDAYSGIPKSDPPPAMNVLGNRMYPPQADRIIRQRDGSITARTRGHEISIGSNGSIAITNSQTAAVEFQQAGTGN